MHELTKSLRWEQPDSRYLTRPMVVMRLTGLGGEVKQWLQADMVNIRRAINYVCEDRQTTWDPFFSCDEVPVVSGARDAEGSVPRAERRRVLWINRTAADRSDLLIAHAWNNGSTMVGDIQRSFLEGPIVRPVVVLRHRENNDLSAAWEGLADEHPQMSVLTFDGEDLLEGLEAWLRDAADRVEEVTAARKLIDFQWRPVAGALTTALDGESEDSVETLGRALGMSAEGLRYTVGSGLALASLDQRRFGLLLDRYGDRVEAAVLDARVSHVLKAGEIQAWRWWSRNTSAAHAEAVLRYEVQQRELPGVNKPRPYLGTPASWNAIEQEHRRESY